MTQDLAVIFENAARRAPREMTEKWYALSGGASTPPDNEFKTAVRCHGWRRDGTGCRHYQHALHCGAHGG